MTDSLLAIAFGLRARPRFTGYDHFITKDVQKEETPKKKLGIYFLAILVCVLLSCNGNIQLMVKNKMNKWIDFSGN